VKQRGDYGTSPLAGAAGEAIGVAQVLVEATQLIVDRVNAAKVIVYPVVGQYGLQVTQRSTD
jgi:hypothetical protein